jgi:ribose-phosphate pyrophosphokinase
MRTGPLCLLACDEAAGLAAGVARGLSTEVTPSRDVWFSSGEAKHVIEANVRGCDVYIFQNTMGAGPNGPGGDRGRSPYDRTMALLHAVDAARHADAGRVTVVIPYLPGSRQDKRKNHVREGVSTGLMARLFAAAGVSMVVTVEPHNEAIVGAYVPSNCVFEAVTVCGPFAGFLEREGLACDVVASTDVGGLEMARSYANRLGRPIAALSKERDYSRPGTVAATTVIGEVRDRSVLIVDDIVDTAGSVASAVRALWAQGATDVVVAGVHVILSEPGWERLHALRAEAETRGVSLRVAATSSVLQPGAPPWYSTFALEDLLAQVIRSVNTRGSVRALENAPTFTDP